LILHSRCADWYRRHLLVQTLLLRGFVHGELGDSDRANRDYQAGAVELEQMGFDPKSLQARLRLGSSQESFLLPQIVWQRCSLPMRGPMRTACFLAVVGSAHGQEFLESVRLGEDGHERELACLALAVLAQRRGDTAELAALLNSITQSRTAEYLGDLTTTLGQLPSGIAP
jgi:hypothetical protein